MRYYFWIPVCEECAGRLQKFSPKSFFCSPLSCRVLMEPNYRRCISCRQVAHKNDLWRIVRVYPSHQLQLDQGMGRSAYLCPQLSCLSAAQKKNRLGRALKASVPLEIYQILWQRLSAMQADASTLPAAGLPKQNQTASQPKPPTRPPTVP